ncbi:nucleoside deaminase [Devosia sediminis]|nr:nucleoside deaminase [Devosia sediminis]
MPHDLNATTDKPMDLALALAEAAAAMGEAPVGAVIMEGNRVLAAEGNRMQSLRDPTAHAELLAMRKALDVRGTGRLDGCDLYVTLEPCAMCAGAIAHTRLRRVYFAAEDTKAGAVENGIRLFEQPTCHHRPEVISGLSAARAEAMLVDFFRKLRD